MWEHDDCSNEKLDLDGMSCQSSKLPIRYWAHKCGTPLRANTYTAKDCVGILAQFAGLEKGSRRSTCASESESDSESDLRVATESDHSSNHRGHEGNTSGSAISEIKQKTIFTSIFDLLQTATLIQ